MWPEPADPLLQIATVNLTVAMELRATAWQLAEAGLTQQQLARRTGSSQSRVATMEAGDPRVSLDLLIRALLRIGASRRDVGQSLARRVT